jgi:hypothetical protein
MYIYIYINTNNLSEVTYTHTHTRVSWFKTDVSGLRICPIFKGQIVQEKQFDPKRWDRYVVTKRRI